MTDRYQKMVWRCSLLGLLFFVTLGLGDGFSVSPVRLGRRVGQTTSASVVTGCSETDLETKNSFRMIQPAVWEAPASTNGGDTIAVWETLVPKPWQNPRGLDRKVHWNASSSSIESASQELLEGVTVLSSPSDTARMVDDLCHAMQTFVTFCDKLHPMGYSARLVASRGRVGTKCPQWHIDHVPVRWIQALVGPGCVFVQTPDVGIHWSAINNLEDDDVVDDRNAGLVDDSVADVRQVEPGKAVLLIGNRWPNRSFAPAVHRSPDKIGPWQGRVLLTMDVQLKTDG